MRPYQSIACSDDSMCCPKISWALTCYQQIDPCECSWQRDRTGDRQIGRWCAEVKEAHGRWGGCSNPKLINCSWILVSEKMKVQASTGKLATFIPLLSRRKDVNFKMVDDFFCIFWASCFTVTSSTSSGKTPGLSIGSCEPQHFQGMLEYSGSPFWTVTITWTLVLPVPVFSAEEAVAGFGGVASCCISLDFARHRCYISVFDELCCPLWLFVCKVRCRLLRVLGAFGTPESITACWVMRTRLMSVLRDEKSPSVKIRNEYPGMTANGRMRKISKKKNNLTVL